jgi:hypothetical protein
LSHGVGSDGADGDYRVVAVRVAEALPLVEIK